MKHAKTIVSVTLLLSVVVLGCKEWRYPVDPKPATPGELQDRAAQVEPGKAKSDISTTSPRNTYDAFRASITEKRFEDTWTLLSAGTQESCKAAAANVKMRVVNDPAPMAQHLDILYLSGLTRATADKLTGKMYFVAASKMRDKDPEAFAPMRNAEYDHEVIQGNNARVYVKINGRRGAEPMKMEREGGVWRVALPKVTPGR